MRYAPIVMFVYNRADHFEKTVNALSKCEEAKSSELYIFSDAAKNSKAEYGVNAVRKLAHEIESQDLFKNTVVIESEHNKGLANSVIAGVTRVIEEFGRVIVLEDDCVPSPYLLRFMNNCLDFYESNDRISSIAGYSPPIRFPDDYTDDVFVAYRTCSWGWATWKDRWDNVDWQLKNIDALYADRKTVKKLNSNGNDRFIRLYRQTKGEGNSWSVKFGTQMVIRDLMTVYPKYSYINNIGCDDSGVHSSSGDAEKIRVDLNKSIKDPKIKNVQIDSRIQKSLKKYYSAGFISDIKRNLFTYGILAKALIGRLFR